MSQIERQTNIVAQLAQFCRFLRSNDFQCTIDSECDLLRVWVSSIPKSKTIFHNISKAILCKCFQEHIRFTELFEQFWSEIFKAVDAKERRKKEQKKQKTNNTAPTITQLKSWLFNQPTLEEEELAKFSPTEVFSKRDFSAFDTSQLDDIIRIVRELTHSLLSRNSRRMVASKKPASLFFRQLFRKNIYHGEILKLIYQKPKVQKTKLLLFCDVSKSMDLYTQFILITLFAFHRVSAKIEAFVFSTKLTRVTQDLTESDFKRALENLSEHVDTWSGGTRIGSSLLEFRQDYGQAFVDKKTNVLIISDGWDQGDTEKLDVAMSFLKKKSKKIIWINPLASRSEYEPSTLGMQCALPYIDILTSAHNLETLMQLVKQLAV